MDLKFNQVEIWVNKIWLQIQIIIKIWQILNFEFKNSKFKIIRNFYVHGNSAQKSTKLFEIYNFLHEQVCHHIEFSYLIPFSFFSHYYEKEHTVVQSKMYKGKFTNVVFEWLMPKHVSTKCDFFQWTISLVLPTKFILAKALQSPRSQGNTC